MTTGGRGWGRGCRAGKIILGVRSNTHMYSRAGPRRLRFRAVRPMWQSRFLRVCRRLYSRNTRPWPSASTAAVDRYATPATGEQRPERLRTTAVRLGTAVRGGVDRPAGNVAAAIARYHRDVLPAAIAVTLDALPIDRPTPFRAQLFAHFPRARRRRATAANRLRRLLTFFFPV